MGINRMALVFEHNDGLQARFNVTGMGCKTFAFKQIL